MTPRGDAAGKAAKGHQAAGHGHNHVLDIADVDHDGHEDVGILVGLIGALTQGVVDLVKALLRLLLVAEDLDDLLAC